MDLGSKTTKCAADHRSTVCAARAAVGILGCGVVWYDLQLQIWFFPESLLEDLNDVNLLQVSTSISSVLVQFCLYRHNSCLVA